MTSSTSPDFDHRRFKQLERAGYNLIAARYAAASALRAELHTALLDAAGLAGGQEVLDLASGPGILAAAALPRVAPGGRVIASDLAEAMLAESRGRHPGIMHAVADGERLPFSSGCFDRVLCGLGLMFLPDEALALAEIRRVLKPGGRVAVSVWAEAAQVPLVECALACMRRLLPVPKVARLSVFRLGDPDQLAALLDAAGFKDIQVEPCELDCSFKNAEDYWQAFLDLAGGAAGSLSRLPAATQAELRSGVAQELAPYADAEGYRLVSRVLIATAGRS
ncbi:MAG: methyltransferase domain-containing protein [Rhodocyclaceae bacterium]|nr:MAG: methyltransferase domain-containing protein [Rhodocyclaceae bacterium]